MATSRIIGGDRLRAKLRALPVAMRDPIRRAIEASALEVERAAKTSVQRGPKTGRVYKKYNPRRTHRASAPGQPPATDTGYLASSVHAWMDPDGLGATVQAHAKYGPYLEYGTENEDGTQRIKPRPFLLPAFERKRKRIADRIARVVKLVLQRSGRK